MFAKKLKRKEPSARTLNQLFDFLNRILQWHWKLRGGIHWKFWTSQQRRQFEKADEENRRFAIQRFARGKWRFFEAKLLMSNHENSWNFTAWNIFVQNFSHVSIFFLLIFIITQWTLVITKTSLQRYLRPKWVSSVSELNLVITTCFAKMKHSGKMCHYN